MYPISGGDASFFGSDLLVGESNMSDLILSRTHTPTRQNKSRYSKVTRAPCKPLFHSYWSHTIYPRPTRRSYVPRFVAAPFNLQIRSSRAQPRSATLIIRRRALQHFIVLSLHRPIFRRPSYSIKVSCIYLSPLMFLPTTQWGRRCWAIDAAVEAGRGRR